MAQVTRRALLSSAATAAAAAAVSTVSRRLEAAPATSATLPTTGAAATQSFDAQLYGAQPIPPTLDWWHSIYGPNVNIQKVRRRETDEDFASPHKGTTTFQRFNGDPVNMDNRWNDHDGPEVFGEVKNGGINENYPQTTIAYCRWIWSRLEPERSKYRWDIIDAALDAAARRGQTLQMRFQPYVGRSFPSWYIEPENRFVNVKGRREHQHNSEDYIRFWGELMTAAGERYDGHPALESFDVAYGGSCGETGGNATAETAARLVDAYVNAFKKTQLITMLGTPGCRYAATLKGRSIGWRADCFGDVHLEASPGYPAFATWNHMFDYYPRELEESGVKDAWKTAPITFETCWTVGHWFNKGWDIDWILEQGLSYHTSVFMPKSSYVPEPWKEKIDAFNRKLGYRFVLRELEMPRFIKPGGRVPFNVWLQNVGVAPIYRAYPLAARFRQGGQQRVVAFQVDIRTWQPGSNWFVEELPLPEGFGDGPVAIDLAIVDPVTHQPRVPLAIPGRGQDGWYPLTFIEVRDRSGRGQS